MVIMDGWMARERGEDWAAGPRKKDPKRVAWHEIKSAVIYRLEQPVEKPSRTGLREIHRGHAAENRAGGFWRLCAGGGFASRAGLAEDLEQAGAPLGSGAVESLGKQLQACRAAVNFGRAVASPICCA